MAFILGYQRIILLFCTQNKGLFFSKYNVKELDNML